METYITNPEIIQTAGDMKIGGKVVLPDNMSDGMVSYNDYILNLVRNRIYSLVSDEIKKQESEGASHQDSINDCLYLIRNMLSIEEADKGIAITDEDGLVDEIMKSFEFKGWSTEIMYRFFDTHKDKVDENTPVPLLTQWSSTYTEGLLEQMENEDSLQLFLDGLSSVLNT